MFLLQIPGGTGNGFNRSIGNKDAVTAARTIIAGNTLLCHAAPTRHHLQRYLCLATGLAKRIDIGRCTYGPKQEQIYFFNVCWWGLCADALVFAEKIRWMRKKRYDFAGAVYAAKAKSSTCRMKVDDTVVEVSHIRQLSRIYRNTLRNRVAPRLVFEPTCSTRVAAKLLGLEFSRELNGIRIEFWPEFNI